MTATSAIPTSLSPAKIRAVPRDVERLAVDDDLAHLAVGEPPAGRGLVHWGARAERPPERSELGVGEARIEASIGTAPETEASDSGTERLRGRDARGARVADRLAVLDQRRRRVAVTGA